MKPTTPDTAIYSAIFKMDENPDGTLLVHGKATDDTLDSDEQVCDPAWLKTAMPEWFKFGNIREQHSSIAAGVATEYKNEGSEHFITAHVVDPGSVAKVKAGVLKGFSIGIRRPRVVKDNKALGGRIVDGQIVEISLVDRPANPVCTLTMAKTVGTELVQVEELAETGSEKMTEITATTLIETSKSFVSEIVKFDQAAFDTARQALATLIQVEAGEMAEGSDETHSLACLFSAVHALFEWHEGEAAEGETTPIEEIENEIEMSDEPEMVKEDEVVVAEEEEKMCDKCDKSEDECKCAEMEATDKAAQKEAELTELRNIITDVVKTLLPTTVGDELTKATETTRIEALESELAQVKSLAAPSNVKRMGAGSSKTQPDVTKSKAAEYRAKALATSDRTLAQGYLDLAHDLEKSN